ncbi:IS1634 family transposase [Shewanella xiamenensis]|uniref:IS1634 family transposase n=1 Tax=Shewanella xiamenensis TaxID=332186 RepID=UPI00294A7ABD|nr:IS1634 family transposase [Shewanella xiamenensis]MDV5249665.1 IS1634 family transposase [Shewanella xiamenensis]
MHLDITSFHVDGAYDCNDGEPLGKLQLVRGYSRDHRPELNQVILELICENQAGLPVYMQALSGNSNDTKAFAQTVRRHLSSLKAAQESRYLVGDAALYCADTLQLLAQQQQLFVTRVPVTLNEAKQAVATIGAQPLTALGNGYHGRWQGANYAGRRAALVAGAQRTGQPSRAADIGQKPAQRQYSRAQSLRQIVCLTLCL